MKMTKLSTRIDGLKKELTYCEHMVAKGHINPHWAIRAKEIVVELKGLKKRKKK